VTPEEVALAEVVRVLEALGIPYMVTGSVASSHHNHLSLRQRRTAPLDGDGGLAIEG
jgi:hypothetical protein